MSDKSHDELNDELNDEPAKPDFDREQFLAWRNPRTGIANPERMTNPVWKWFHQNKLNAYQANQYFDGPDSMSAGPVWTTDRFGQTSTKLSDGRNVLIGGEHEDFYDPDFYIYNDVIVESTDGELEIYGYDREKFPPTDFHTATRVGDQIILIGNTGYPESRAFGTTQVLTLDLKTLKISQETAGGDCPGWISRHSAKLSEDRQSIIVTGGHLFLDEDSPMLENFDSWRLDIQSWNWERLTDVKWQQWHLARDDGEPNNLWNIRSSLDRQGMGLSDETILEQFPPEARELMAEALSVDESIDPTQLDQLYSPPIDHKTIERELLDEEDDNCDQYNSYRIEINGVVIRFTENMYQVEMVVEGELPDQIVSQVMEDTCNKLEQIEKAKFVAQRFD